MSQNKKKNYKEFDEMSFFFFFFFLNFVSNFSGKFTSIRKSLRTTVPQQAEDGQQTNPKKYH
jgi:hypothetical protein